MRRIFGAGKEKTPAPNLNDCVQNLDSRCVILFKMFIFFQGFHFFFKFFIFFFIFSSNFSLFLFSFFFNFHFFLIFTFLSNIIVFCKFKCFNMIIKRIARFICCYVKSYNISSFKIIN